VFAVFGFILSALLLLMMIISKGSESMIVPFWVKIFPPQLFVARREKIPLINEI
jgi:hypothetical protein